VFPACTLSFHSSTYGSITLLILKTSIDPNLMPNKQRQMGYRLALCSTLRRQVRFAHAHYIVNLCFILNTPSSFGKKRSDPS